MTEAVLSPIVKEKTKVKELGRLIKFVTGEHPLITNNSLKIAEAIELEFNVICEEQDVIDYNNLHVQVEDYELEDRRVVYGVIY